VKKARILRAGRVVDDPSREVRDVYWSNYFGPAYVDRWAGRMESLGVKQFKTAAGGCVVWSTDTPFVHDPKARTLGAYEWKRPFYEALGNDTFMWEGQKQREPGEVVPRWDDHHRAAGVDVALLPGPNHRSSSAG
jgi:hypothetical protein